MRCAVVAGVLVALLAVPTARAATFGAGPPAFTVYPAPEDVPNSNNAGEPTIGVNWRSGNVLMQNFSSTVKVAFNDATIPAGVVWEDAVNPTGTLNLDPILFTDATLGRTWGGGLQGPCGNLAFTDSDGEPWTKTKPCSGTVDHETIGAGPWAGTPPEGATYPHAVYYCAQFPLADACVTSRDGGATWGSPVPTVGCQRLHGHVKVGPDGTAYVPNNHCVGAADGAAEEVGGAISNTNGASWGAYRIPGATTPLRGFDPSVGIASDNTLYEAWARADDYHPMVARSKDHGATWDNVTDLGKTVGPAIVASTFHTVIAGDPDRVAVAYLATQTGAQELGKSPFDTGFEGVWHLFVSTSYDGGKEWQTVKVTDDPVQRGCIWDQGGVNDCRNLLDFMDTQLTKDGRVVVGFADGCILDCALPAGTAADSTSALATLARQSTGRGLFAAYDTVEGAPTPTPTPVIKPNRRPRACLRLRALRLRVVVDGRCSTDRDGFIKRYRWSWGDRKHSRGATARHRYKRKGRYRITLVVTDNRGARSSARRGRVKLPAKRPPHREFGEPDGH